MAALTVIGRSGDGAAVAAATTPSVDRAVAGPVPDAPAGGLGSAAPVSRPGSHIRPVGPVDLGIPDGCPLDAVGGEALPGVGGGVPPSRRAPRRRLAAWRCRAPIGRGVLSRPGARGGGWARAGGRRGRGPGRSGPRVGTGTGTGRERVDVGDEAGFDQGAPQTFGVTEPRPTSPTAAGSGPGLDAGSGPAPGRGRVGVRHGLRRRPGHHGPRKRSRAGHRPTPGTGDGEASSGRPSGDGRAGRDTGDGRPGRRTGDGRAGRDTGDGRPGRRTGAGRPAGACTCLPCHRCARLRRRRGHRGGRPAGGEHAPELVEASVAGRHEAVVRRRAGRRWPRGAGRGGPRRGRGDGGARRRRFLVGVVAPRPVVHRWPHPGGAEVGRGRRGHVGAGETGHADEAGEVHDPRCERAGAVGRTTPVHGETGPRPGHQPVAEGCRRIRVWRHGSHGG